VHSSQPHRHFIGILQCLIKYLFSDYGRKSPDNAAAPHFERRAEKRPLAARSPTHGPRTSTCTNLAYTRRLCQTAVPTETNQGNHHFVWSIQSRAICSPNSDRYDTNNFHLLPVLKQSLHVSTVLWF